jgi:glutamate formiminotransferase/formiminotetrahydrofolate cyclodeaminase
MAKKVIECVPNISEGSDKNKIQEIVNAAKSVEGVRVLDVDAGKATNRTVITFVGGPEEVCEAAFRLIKKAAELIDMSYHKGEHPRMGATDVCPLVPVSGISMEETAAYAQKLGKRVGEELGIPVYLYENAAQSELRKNLANCRAGEYEGLQRKIGSVEWQPDFGPTEFNNRVRTTGATAIGARDFLVAYNINLNTTSTRRANAVAFDIREKGRIKREGNPFTGKIILNKNGEPETIPGSLKAVKGIGWFIEEYGIAQVSLNLNNISVTPMHIAFEEACKKADERGLRVTGSELVGLIPLKAMLDAGKYFLKKQQRSTGVSDEELIKIAIRSLGLDELSSFNPKERIIEYLLNESSENKLIDLSLTKFAIETAADSPAPGGGSISAYVGALGAALGTMVANLSSHKRGWDDKWEYFSDWAEKGKKYYNELLFLVDEDTKSFNGIMEAFKLPKNTEEEKEERKNAIENATRYAIEIPLKAMETAYNSMEVMECMVKEGMESSLSDAAVGMLCARTAVEGAYLNVQINMKGFKDAAFIESTSKKAIDIHEKAIALEKSTLDFVKSKF